MRGEDNPQRVVNPLPYGSPPHARGRRLDASLIERGQRITPACAGKTNPTIQGSAAPQDHPRMRGEDAAPIAAQFSSHGSPPHARGRLEQPVALGRPFRITPACAGKTWAGFYHGVQLEDHPRMRGEDASELKPETAGVGSPPHARGRPRTLTGRGCRPRITPACAGKTEIWASDRRSYRDHPRMRGEDDGETLTVWSRPGSPPHARGRLPELAGNRLSERITPACAGKTCRTCVCVTGVSDHPRMRGEDEEEIAPGVYEQGSPPHARGRPTSPTWCQASFRITPACAGKTVFGQRRRRRRSGSPPHARGRR